MRREFCVFCVEPLQPTQGSWLVPLHWNPQNRPKGALFRGLKKQEIFSPELHNNTIIAIMDNLQSKIFFNAEIIIFSVFYLGMLNTIDRRMAGST